MIPDIAPARASDWAHACVQAGTEPVLLDVREGWELDLASIRLEAGSFAHIPMQTIPAAIEDGRLQPDQPVLVMCHHGVRSMHVARYLQANGFTQVHNLTGGIHAWSSQYDDKVPVY